MNVRRRLELITKNPRILGRQFNRYWHRFKSGEYNPAAINIFDEDWDNLLLLDACRYDLFTDVVDLSGELSAVESKGTNTIQFLKGNLTGRDLLDTVYVTANPQFQKIRDELNCEFHAVVDVWHDDWDESVQTVRPETTAVAAREAAETYSNKRLFVHFNQPHVPFIGDEGSEVFDIEEIIDHPLPFWHQPMAGAWDASDEDIRDAYRENLRSVLPHVEMLLEELEGKTVVTSDHGNMIGERGGPIPIREYGHPRWIYADELVTVPWLVCESERRKIVNEEPGDASTQESRKIAQRLDALGYK